MILEAPNNNEWVRVLDISQLFKEHLTDRILSVSRKAAEHGFSEHAFDVFGFVDHRNTAMLRYEARDRSEHTTLYGSYVWPYRDISTDLLHAFEAGHVCFVKRAEIEVLVNAPDAIPQYSLYLQALEEWKQKEGDAWR